MSYEVLLATIKVQVKGGNFSVAERAEMYASTLRYYAQTIGKSHPILFLENSDFDLSFYENGFRFYSFEDDAVHDMQSKIMMTMAFAGIKE